MWKLMQYLSFVTLLSACSDASPPLALGTLERDRVILTATASELILAQPVTEGSQVQRGDLLVQLDDRQQRAVVEQAQAEVASAAALLEKLENGARKEVIAGARAELKGAQAQLTEAEHNLDRARTLVARKVAGQADLDAALANRDARRAQVLSAQEHLNELLNGTRPEDLRQAEAELQAARARADQQQTRLEEYQIIATRDGWLDSLPWNTGERVQAGSPIAVTLAGDAPFARVYIPEPYRAQIRVGTELTVRVDGLDQRWTGKVRWIAIEAAFTPYFALNAEERSRLVYLAEVQLPDDASELPSGVPAQVELPQ